MYRRLRRTLLSLTVRQKLTFTICGGTLLTIFLTGAIIIHQVSGLLEKELIHKGTIIAVALSKQSIDPIMRDDPWEIYKSIKNVTGRTYMPFLEYIVVLDRSGKILAHSHAQYFRVGDTLPEEPFSKKAFRAKDLFVQSRMVSKKERLYDIAAPSIVGTEKLGVIRVGLTDRILREELAEVKRDIFLVALLLSGGGIMVGVLVAYRITGPLSKVTQNIMKISKGQLKDVFPIKATGKDEIGRMVEIFNEMAKNLKTKREMDEYMARKDKLVMLGEFSAGIAHEIKNPLTAIKMLMQSAKEHSLSAKDIEVIEGEINRIDRIVRDFLAFARPAKTERVNTDVNEILREVVTLIRSEVEKLHITLVEDFSDDVPMVMAQPDEIKQVILNIVLNAIEAMKTGGALRILSFVNDGRVSITVSDNGPGISEESIGHIFEPFFTTKEDGTGMGLAIADRIVSEHGGHINVDSAPGKGTTVLVVLPL